MDHSQADKSPSAFKTISEVAEELDIPQHVLRFWENKFPQISPVKRRGGRRYYRPEDVEKIRAIKRLLYEEGFTIKGAVRHFAKHPQIWKEAANTNTSIVEQPQPAPKAVPLSVALEQAQKAKQASNNNQVPKESLNKLLRELYDIRKLAKKAA